MSKLRILGWFLWREWRDQRRNRALLALYILLPAIGAVLPAAMAMIPVQTLASEPELLSYLGLFDPTGTLSNAMNPLAATYLVRLTSGIYAVMVVGIVSTVGGYSIVGERMQRTLEPLLCTPVSTAGLLSAKLMALCTPAVVMTWIAALAAALALRLSHLWLGAPLVVPDAFFWTMVFLATPIIAWITGCLCMHISMRQTDPQAATQITALAVAPLLVVSLALSAPYIGTRLVSLWTACAIAAAAAALLHYSLCRTFGRAGMLARL